MGTRLYVGNLAFSVTEDDLRALFAPVGTVVDAQIGLRSQGTGSVGRARGFGFVEMSSEEEATLAIAKLDRCDLQGRSINVKLPQEPAGPMRRFDRRPAPRPPTAG